MKRIVWTILLLFVFGNCLGQEFTLLEVEYARYPSATILKMDSIEANFSEYQVSLLIPVLHREKWAFLAGANYRLVVPGSEDRQSDDDLFFLGLQLASVFHLMGDKELIFTALPAISTTNKPGRFYKENFLMQGGILFKNQLSERFSYRMGVISTSSFGKPLILPSLGITRAGDNMKLEVNLPFFAKTMWNYTKPLSFGFGIDVNGSQYNFNNESFNGAEVDLVRFSRLRLGPEFEYRITEPLVFELFTGIAAKRTYDFEMIGGDDIDLSLENGLFISMSISIKPSTNKN